MDTKETIAKEVTTLHNEGVKLVNSFLNEDEKSNFPYKYQAWYTKALRVVGVLALDRLPEFKAYYEIDPKRKSLGYSTYVIQDYLKGVVPGKYNYPDFDPIDQAGQCFVNQLTIFRSLSERIDSVLASIDYQLLSELQDAELNNAKILMKVSVRASGSLVGVIIEHHLQKLIKKHNIPLRKKHPTISDMNDPLKNAGVFDIPTWRKITYLADIRNICSHKKDIEPSKEQVTELIEGANWLIKNIF